MYEIVEFSQRKDKSDGYWKEETADSDTRGAYKEELIESYGR